MWYHMQEIPGCGGFCPAKLMIGGGFMSLDKLLRHTPVRFVYNVLSVFFEKHVSRAAAELAYFFTLTIFPILICVNALCSRFHLDLVYLLDSVDSFMPAGVAGVLRDYLMYLEGNESAAMLTAGLVTAVLLASAAVRSLMNIMEEIYGSASFHGIWRMAASVVIAALLLVTVYLSIVVLITGNWFFRLLEGFFHLEHLLERFALWQWMKYLLLFGLVFLVILLLYRVSLPLDKPRPPVVRGALLASVALAAASVLFSFFIGLSARYSLVYGSLASVMILLVWLYLCGHILILGNVLNYVWYKLKREKS